MKNHLTAILLLPVMFSAVAEQTIDYQKQVELLQQVQKALLSSGITNKDGPLLIEEPSRSIYHFGAILDAKFVVVAVTPESDAAKLGLKEGDKLLAINQQRVSDSNLADILAKINELADDDALSVQLLRADKQLNLKGTVSRQALPGWRLELLAAGQQNELPASTSCGYVSVFYNTPTSLRRHPVKINEIDTIGFRAGFSYKRTHEVIKVPVGEIQITLQEHIPGNILSRYRGDLRARNFGSVKTLTLKVEPDTVYHLAAEYFPNPNDRSSRDAYWQPVVWKTTARDCN
ncbi:hypothetical protein AGRI_11173 [Alishewanella agri BL06]|uniref:PDZ domain-containing protein n=1 Tax=Alishewanella agri BL06 TaxID=1195246 RepID=I9P0R9_9ALTE|nr:PDZ domain-containing protein [Alishewanella agri]EIW88502.1 hypothetical protein AGRI_11173 [Alishewanella agri BL06]